MLGNKQEARNKIYLNIKNGQVVRRTPQGEEHYSFVEGKLENITQKERNFRGETVLYWYIDLRDVGSGDLYSLGFPYGSNVYKSIILQIAAAQNYDNIRIEPYSRNGYDKAQVYASGTKLDWVVRELPPIEQTSIGGRVIKDDSKRMNLIKYYANQVLSRIGKQVANQTLLPI